MLNISRRTLPIADQAMLVWWRLVFVSTQALDRAKRAVWPVLGPAVRLLWLPPLALAAGFFMGIAFAAG